MNIGSLLSNTAAKFPRNTALVYQDERILYKDLDKRCGCLAGALLASGLSPGDRVAILAFNSPLFVEAYYAAVRVGLVATPINFRLTGGEMSFILRDSGAKALIMGPEFQDTVLEIRDDLEELDLLVMPGKPVSGVEPYEGFLNRGRWLPPSAEIMEPHACQLMYTSGTTGRPKGAVISHGNVIWNLHNTIYGREDRAGQMSIVVGPLYHTAALNNHLTIQVALGGACILIPKFDPEQMLQTIEGQRATTISGSPAMYNLLLQHSGAHAFDLTSITKCTAGADKLLMETKRRLLEFFPNINGVYDVYGCTEASPCINILNQRDSLRKDACVGPALPYLDARVVDYQGSPLPAGSVGELVCRGPNVMQAYHNNPQATSEALREGWLYTGDLARMDEEGFFYIVDRKKDMIVSGGENIYPREIEEVLFTHPAIEDAAVLGVPDSTWGENVKAFITLKPGADLKAEEVISFCKEHLAGYKKPKLVEFIPEIPRNPSGKALKRELRRRS